MNKEKNPFVAKHRMPKSPRALDRGRRSLVALVTGAGVALTPLPALAAADTSAPAASAPQHVVGGSGAAQRAVGVALAQLGDPYRWGASGPNAFDCSGLTSYAYRLAGVDLPRSSRAQSQVGTPVSRADLQPGDLVFYFSPVSHVGMYVGNGRMVHASTYGQPVKVIDMRFMPGYAGARRIR